MSDDAWVGLHCVIVTLPGHTHLLFTFVEQFLIIYQRPQTKIVNEYDQEIAAYNI